MLVKGKLVCNDKSLAAVKLLLLPSSFKSVIVSFITALEYVSSTGLSLSTVESAICFLAFLHEKSFKDENLEGLEILKMCNRT
jgi:hypothetical protein